MKEDFLHYIWQHQYYEKSALESAAGEPVQVLRTGYHNTEAGPDFREAVIQISEVEWSGSVEIHLRASDWHHHKHQHDRKYDQVVLHVVWENDAAVTRTDGSVVPVLELKKRVAPGMLQTYEQLQKSKAVIPCSSFWPNVNELTKTLMLERALVERLEEKAESVLRLYKQLGNDWEQTAYALTLRGFGFKTNQAGFEQLATALPLTIVRKHQQNLLQLEALLFGQAGCLGAAPDEYMAALQKEFLFLSHKYSLSGKEMQVHQWNFLRMRPANFPTVRLAQLAAMLYQLPSLFSKLLEAASVKELEAIYQAPVSGYWQEHYMPGRSAKSVQKAMGKSSAQNLISNVVVPLLAAYAQYTGEQKFLEKGIHLLEQLKEESNIVTRQYEALGWRAKSAADNQAAIGLFRRYCEPVYCMRCAIGNNIMKRSSSPA